MMNFFRILKPFWQTLNSKRRVVALFTLMLVGIFPVASSYAQESVPTPVDIESSFDLERVKRATVFIMQARATTNAPIITCISSGTLVSRDGLILTNAHSTVPGENCPGDTLIIALNLRDNEPPVPLYRAEVVQANPGLDLALLRITRQNDGRLVDTASLSLPFVELADSDAVRLDSTVTLIGYPGLGNDPISVVRGTINGFIAEPSGGTKSWFKTSTPVPGAFSGGGAYNQDGQLIGIPTTAPIAANSPEANCLILQDTNGDGQSNSADACVAVGGLINSLRPTNFVRPLLRAASLGIQVSIPTMTAAAGQMQTSASGTPRFRRMFFAPAVNEAGMPTTTIRSLPAGSTGLYLFFDYENMTPETVYELRVTIDGVLNPIYGLSPVRWSGGRSGSWYVGTTEQPLPNGVYDFTLFINGVASESQRLLVGQSVSAPTFTDIIFGLEDLQGNVLGNGFVLPVGTTASARFIFRNMENDTPWAAIWYREGNEIIGSRTPDGTVWQDGEQGIKTIRIQSPTGLLPGNYRLDLYIDGRLAATSNFTLAGAQQGSFARIFDNTHFATADTPDEAVNAPPVTSFPTATEAIYALFDWEQIGTGTLWTMQWYIDEDLFYEQTIPWFAPQSGEDFVVQVMGRDTLPDGTYRMELRLNNLLFASQSARIGIGLLPIDRFAVTEGIQMRGTILDAVTNQGIPGATVFIITEDFSAADFTRDWQQDQIFDLSVTDSSGFFQIDRLLQPGIQYSIVIVAQGYLPITADAVEFVPDDNPVDIPIYLTRG